MEGRFLVNAGGFWAEKGIIRAAFTRRKHRAAFPCKRGQRHRWGLETSDLVAKLRRGGGFDGRVEVLRRAGVFDCGNQGASEDEGSLRVGTKRLRVFGGTDAFPGSIKQETTSRMVWKWFLRCGRGSKIN